MKSLTFSFPENFTQSKKELLIAGLMLYLGEGAKTRNTVDLANSDPKILKLFMHFLREIFVVREEKLRFYLYCFSDQDPEELIQYWCQALNVSALNFTKPYIRPVVKNSTRRMSYGVLHIRYNDKRLLEKILALCSSITDELLHLGGYSSGQRRQTVKGSLGEKSHSELSGITVKAKQPPL